MEFALRDVGRFQVIFLSDRLVKQKNVGPGEKPCETLADLRTLDYLSANAGFSPNVAQVKVDMSPTRSGRPETDGHFDHAAFAP
jgi:hypothetical protein